MRKNNGRRRHRGQNRRNFNNLNKNTVIESFGPISQIRGNVQQLNEKYNNLGNDAASNDDKVLSETYYQFADHYHRLLKEIEISNENKNLNGFKADNVDEKDDNLVVDDELKPSRKERSINAKIKEDEERTAKSNASELELTEGDNKIKDSRPLSSTKQVQIEFKHFFLNRLESSMWCRLTVFPYDQNKYQKMEPH